MILYFSGTGSSRFVAEAIADRLSDKVFSLNEIIKKHKKATIKADAEQPWVFVFPIYLSTMPEIVKECLRSMSFVGSSKAYFVGCCAGSVGSAGNRASDICSEKGWEYMGIAQVPMPQNYIALFAMYEPDEISRRMENALASADEISEAVRSGDPLDMKLTSGIERKAVELVEKMYNGMFTGTKPFYATDACVGCGLCEKNCPLNKITMGEDGRPHWKGSCIHCMSCINRCPKQAIEYGKKTVGKRRYVCEKYKHK